MVSAVEGAFTDVTLEAGVDYLQWDAQGENRESLRVTGGAAAGDINGDGYPDLFVTRLDGPDILFLNNKAGGFTDASVAAGFIETLPTNGVALGDIDNDGDGDLYLTAVGATRHYLYVNDGSGRFTEEALPRGAAIATGKRHLGMSAGLGDYDGDGYLDMHVTEWGNISFDPSPTVVRSHARMLRNAGADNPGHFTDTTLSSRVFLDGRVGYGASNSIEGLWRYTSTFVDLDRDGHADLAIAGDFHTSDLFWNNGDGTFTQAHGPDMPNPIGIGTDENGMGSAFADINGDGLLDWFVTSIYDPAEPCRDRTCNWNGSGNRLYLNNGDRTFTDVSEALGVRDGGWGWGTTFFDYDNDGDQDLVMTNGMVSTLSHSEKFYEDPMKLWRNNGDGTFTEVAQEEGLTDTASGKGLLTFDYDLDGDQDLFVANNAGHPKLYRNDAGETNSFLKVEVEGTQSNRDGVGAYLTLIADPEDTPQLRYIAGGGVNYLSQSDLTVHFGLGPRENPIHELVIDWPSGTRQTFRNVPINTTLRAVEPVAEPASGLLGLVALGGWCMWRRRLITRS